jgi:uncharacterized protein YciI
VPEILHLLFYEYVAGIADRRRPYREQHLALIRRFRDEGRLAVAGAVGDPPHLGLLAMRTRADAESFMHEDPYLVAGLVERWRVEPWSVVAADLPPLAGEE